MSLNIVNSFKLAPPPPDIIGGWKELGRTTLGSSGATLAVSGLADKRYYMYLINGIKNTASLTQFMRLNGDAGGNYAYRNSEEGGTDTVAGGSTSMLMGTDSPNSVADNFTVGYAANLATKEKLLQSHQIAANTVGSGSPPNRAESVAKHAQTTNPIDEIAVVASDFNTGSEMVVLEWDPADTHTDNFWEELASADLSGGAADDLNTGTFAAKKYLWVQYYKEQGGVCCTNSRLTFNNDSGGNYSWRRSLNGAADLTSGSATFVSPDGHEFGDCFVNLFIVNNAVNEKLCISSSNSNTTVGAATAPQRAEMVFKWANTVDQITSINLNNTDTTQMGINSIIKVWGSD